MNTNWANSVEPNTFGTHEFMDFAEQIGSEAYISVNMGSGTVEEAADWIAYMTAAPPSTAGKSAPRMAGRRRTGSNISASAMKCGAVAGP